MFRECFKQGSNVLAIEGGHFQVVLEAQLFCQFKRLFLPYLATVFFVCEVANQVDEDVLVGIVFNFCLPSSHRLKGFSHCDIKNDYYCLAPLIENPCNRSKTLLARCVPNLKFYHAFLAVRFLDCQSIISKFYPNSHIMFTAKLIVNQFGNHAWLSNPRIANDDDLPDCVVLNWYHRVVSKGCVFLFFWVTRSCHQ